MKKYIINSLICLFLLSCDYLDVVPDDIATIDNAFTDRTQAEKFLATCYSQLPRRGHASVDGHCDDMVWSHRNVDWLNQYHYILLRDGNSVSDPYCNNWNARRGGTAMFQAIRNCNILIERINEVRDLDTIEKKRWEAEAKFLKAYYHFYLLQQYGPIPIVKDNVPVEASKEEVMAYREPVDEVFDYVLNLIDEAVPYLPLKIENSISEQGRITQALALAVKAKIAVTAASPLFNGNTSYKSFKDKRDIPFFNSEFDKTKWEKAVIYCKNAIDTCLLAGHELYEVSGASFNISEETRLVIQPSRIVSDKWNVEHIWGYAGTTTNISYLLEEYTIPPLDPDHNTFTRSVTVPTLKAVEMFYTKNGVPIDEDNSYDYANRYKTTYTSTEDKAFMQPNVQTAVLHTNREPRFYGSLGVDGGWWFGLGKYDENNQWAIKAKAGQVSGGRGTERFSITGLYIKKLSNFQSAYNKTEYKHERWNFPVMRLADLYLLYAEALNESLEAPNDEVYRYVDLIRNRAGLKGVVESWENYSKYKDKPSTKTGMRDIIRRERTIELAFEEHRFFDLKRWGIASKELNGHVRGWNYRGSLTEDFYRVTPIDYVQFSERDVLWPIRQYELTVNTNLVQNPGW